MGLTEEAASLLSPAAGPDIKSQDAEWPEEPDRSRVTRGFDTAYAGIQDFLSSKLAKLDDRRSRYLSGRDFSSEENYLRSIRPYRDDLMRLLGVPSECPHTNAQALRREAVTVKEGVRIDRVILKTCGGKLRQYGLIGMPANMKKPMPLVVAIHGSAGSPERIFGLDDADTYEMPEYHHEFALRLAKEGFVVYAPQMVTEKKLLDVVHFSESRDAIDMRAMPAGYRLLGIELGQLMSAIGYMRTQPEVRREAIGAYGISLGGEAAFYLAAVDQRVRATVVSQWIEDRDRNLMGPAYSEAAWRYVSELSSNFRGLLSHFDDIDVASLIMPRALFIESGRRDERSHSVEKVAPRIEALYEKIDAPDNSICVEIGRGGHEIIMNGSLEFLRYWLLADGDADTTGYCGA